MAKGRHEDDGAWQKAGNALLPVGNTTCACACHFNAAPSLHAQREFVLGMMTGRCATLATTGHSSPTDSGNTPLILSSNPSPPSPLAAADMAARPCTQLPSHSPMGKENPGWPSLPSGPRLSAGSPFSAIRRPVDWSQPASSSINHRPCSHPCRRLVPSTYPTHRIDDPRRHKSSDCHPVSASAVANRAKLGS